MNASTLKMYLFTISYFDDMGYEWEQMWDCYDFKIYWLNMLNKYPEAYDEEWYALIGTKEILPTIDWDFISVKYNETRAVKSI